MDKKYLSWNFGLKDGHKIDVYLEKNGYKAVRKALKMKPGSIMDEVKKAGLRGRGGAGFPAGVKWGFVPQKTAKPKYLCVNADEGEPGTVKDRYIMTHNPHQLIEGIIITAFCVGIHNAYIYIRGEYDHIARRLEEAVEEARSEGFLGEDIQGSGFDLDIFVHRGAGAYICGEETALLESLEGKRGNPRLKPPFPASVGLFNCPTVINNIETVANVPVIINIGAEAFQKTGKERDGGTRLFSVSGPVKKPGVYELPVGTSLKDIIFKHAGGMLGKRKLKAVIPGGMSAPILREDEIDLPMDFDSLVEKDSMLGSAGIIVIDEGTSIVDVLRVVSKFYSHESCGQCSPCRIGNAWIYRIVKRIAAREAGKEDLDNIVRLAGNMLGKTLCPLGDAAAMPILSIMKKFRSEIEDYLEH